MRVRGRRVGEQKVIEDLQVDAFDINRTGDCLGAHRCLSNRYAAPWQLVAAWSGRPSARSTANPRKREKAARPVAARHGFEPDVHQRVDPGQSAELILLFRSLYSPLQENPGEPVLALSPDAVPAGTAH